MSQPKVAAIIVAAGSGKRIGGDRPKQFIEIDGKPILQHTLQKFQTCADIDALYVILPAEWTEKYETTIREEWEITKLIRTIKGGAERHDSVAAGLRAVDESMDIIMIHDGVRPFVSHAVLRNSIHAANEHGAAVVGLMPKDTVKKVSGEFIEKTIPRDTLLLAQTPQTFRRDVILQANAFAFEHKKFSTDDTALVEQMGYPVVEGEWRNIKITSPDDLVIAKAFLEDAE